MARPAQAAFPGQNGKIVFGSDRKTGPGVNNPESDGEIFTINPDGTGLTRLTFNAVTDTEPAFSADGSGQTNHTNASSREGRPDWQPIVN